MSNKGRIAIIVTFAVIVGFFVSARGIAGFYTDYLWFDSLGQGDVFKGILGAKIQLAVIFTATFFVLLYANLFLAGRLAPKFRATGPEEAFIERYQQAVGRRTWLVNGAVALLFGLIAGIGVSGQWQQWLLFQHYKSFGIKDPQFDTDIGFYVFRLPFLTFLVSWLFASLVIVLIITAVAHYLNGGIRLQAQGRHVLPYVKAHLSVLLGVLALLKAGGYWLQRYQLTVSARGVVNGATYTDVKAQLPAIYLLILISVLAFVLLIVNIWQRGWRLPVIAVGLWGLVALVAGAIYPTVIQRIVVQPTESSKEEPYIARNIAATRAALGIDKVETQPYTVGQLDAAGVKADSETVADSRLLDPSSSASTFQNLQQIKGYYTFNDIDVDRYKVDGTDRAVVIAARELKSSDLPLNSWEGRHLGYTHGYGVAVAPASKIEANGTPAFVDLTKPGITGIAVTRPEVYFGENLESYAVVNTKREEITLDLNRQSETTTTYQGTGGVSMGSTLKRLAFALRFGEPNLVLSNLITPESRILYVRDVRDRVKQLAPFLDFDANPYTVVLNGRIYWIIDAYTTTDRYPNAQTAETAVLPGNSGLRHSFNYVRNSVKAVIDAYDGSVNYYVVDDTDPLIRSYRDQFPKLFSTVDQAPAGLVDHFRYPEDIFNVQTTMWNRYHIDDPNAFYAGTAAWNVAQNPPRTQDEANATLSTTNALGVVRTKERRVDPYYTLMRLPGSSTTEFLSLRTFVQFSEDDTRKQLVAFMTASSDPKTYGRLRVYQVSDPLPFGPALVASDLSRRFADDLTLLDSNGSKVIFGDLQLLPIGSSIAYVRPWFVQATGNTSVPELRFVSVTIGEVSYKGRTLDEAMASAFPGTTFDFGQVVPTGTGSGSGTGGTGTGGTGGGTTTTTAPGGSTTTTTPKPPSGSVEELLSKANTLLSKAEADLKRTGDLGAYQAAVREAQALVAQAASLITGTTVKPATSSATTVPSTPPTATGNTTTTASA